MYATRMDKARIIAMRKNGESIAAIMADQGVGRTSVYKVLTDAGLTREKVTRPSMIDFEPPPRHRRQPAYRMMLALTARTQGLDIGDTTEEKLESFVRMLDERVWTYDNRRGFHWVPRDREVHGDAVFVHNA